MNHSCSDMQRDEGIRWAWEAWRGCVGRAVVRRSCRRSVSDLGMWALRSSPEFWEALGGAQGGEVCFFHNVSI